MKIEPLIDSIKQSIATGVSNPVRIVDRTTLLDIITEDNRKRAVYISLVGIRGKERLKAIFTNIKIFLIHLSKSSYLNFIIALSVIVLCALSLVAMFSFFLSQVILPTPNHYVNDQGALVFDQPLETVYYMYLHNTAKLWANSGIELVEGDKVTITVSGGFYSDIIDLNKSARENKKLEYGYFHKTGAATNSSKYLLQPDKPFGALLYRIEQPVSPVLPSDSIPFVKEKRNDAVHEISFTAPTSGILHFAVNDIVLTKKVGDQLEKDTVKSLLKDRYEIIKKKQIKDSVDFISKDLEKVWFDDNCGELLINVKVTRGFAHNKNLPYYDKIFIYLMRLLDRKDK